MEYIDGVNLATFSATLHDKVLRLTFPARFNVGCTVTFTESINEGTDKDNFVSPLYLYTFSNVRFKAFKSVVCSSRNVLRLNVEQWHSLFERQALRQGQTTLFTLYGKRQWVEKGKYPLHHLPANSKAPRSDVHRTLSSPPLLGLSPSTPPHVYKRTGAAL